jgi:hypothetical protein
MPRLTLEIDSHTRGYCCSASFLWHQKPSTERWTPARVFYHNRKQLRIGGDLSPLRTDGCARTGSLRPTVLTVIWGEDVRWLVAAHGPRSQKDHMRASSGTGCDRDGKEGIKRVVGDGLIGGGGRYAAIWSPQGSKATGDLERIMYHAVAHPPPLEDQSRTGPSADGQHRPHLRRE